MLAAISNAICAKQRHHAADENEEAAEDGAIFVEDKRNCNGGGAHANDDERESGAFDGAWVDAAASEADGRLGKVFELSGGREWEMLGFVFQTLLGSRRRKATSLLIIFK